MEEVSVVREGRLALNRISLEIKSGERVAILGPNGSGKSTLLKLIYRDLYPHPRSGYFRLLGMERWDIVKLRSSLGIVSADLAHQISPNLLAVEAVLLGFTGRLGLYSDELSPDKYAQAMVSMARVDATGFAGRTIGSLSSGELRRVLLARALVHDPLTLLFDEPTTSLDLVSSHRFIETMRTQIIAGRGLLLVTHHLEEIIPEIDRVILLGQGRILADGPRETVMTEANLEAAFGVAIDLSGTGPYRASIRT